MNFFGKKPNVESTIANTINNFVTKVTPLVDNLQIVVNELQTYNRNDTNNRNDMTHNPIHNNGGKYKCKTKNGRRKQRCITKKTGKNKQL